MNATMCLIRGMIAQTILRDDPPYYREMLDFWKAELRHGFPGYVPPRAEGSIR